MARRSNPRRRIWGRSELDSLSISAGNKASAPLGINIDPDQLVEATLVRVIVTNLGATGNIADKAYFAVLVADEDTFPTAADPVTETDMDWMMRVMVQPIVTANASGANRRDYDVRSMRKLREQDREPYFVIGADAGNAGAMIVSLAVQALFLLK